MRDKRETKLLYDFRAKYCQFVTNHIEVFVANFLDDSTMMFHPLLIDQQLNHK